MATLPHEMTIEILLRLSVKDLLRFKCVSKPWCSSIDDPDFIKLHLFHSVKTNTNHSLILRHCEYHFFSVNYDSLKTTQRLNHPLGEQKTPIKILGSCNGLLALIDDNGRIFLWNPSTRKSQVLPSSEIEFSSPSIFFPRSTYCGFGYDPISDDYKLVRMVQVHGKNNSYLHSEAKEFRFVELPDSCLNKRVCMNMKAMGGYLCLITTYTEFNDDVVDIWIMKESWIKLISWKKSESILGFPIVIPLAFSKSGDKVLFSIALHKFVWYVLGSKRVENVGIRGLPSSFDVGLYVESLVPLMVML
ncbi:hypothetical protein ERO13_A08G015400v2 [Gossypium hirsutum]|nr:hypothetical protein ERO13_A08G015400v2 [Gossypium hirsutum]